MTCLIFFSPAFLFSVVAVSLALMVFLTVVYAGDRKQKHLFVAAWSILLIVDAIGIISIRAEGDHAARRVRGMLGALADHLMVSLHDIGGAIRKDTPTEDPAYGEVMDLLSVWQSESSRICDLFTIGKTDDGRYYLILSPAFDNNRDGTISGQWEEAIPPGTIYDIRAETALKDIDAAFQGESVISAVPYRDDWGCWITAYRPLKDGDGNVVAVFGVDYWGDDWNREILRARMGPSLFFYTFLFFFYLQLFYFIRQRREERNLRYYSHELERMVETTEEIRRHQGIANQNKRVVLENMYREVKRVAVKSAASIREFESLCLGDRSDLFRHSELALEKIQDSAGEYLTFLDSIHNYLRISVEKTVSRQEICQIRHHLDLFESDVMPRFRNKPGLSFEITVNDNVPETIMVDNVRLRTILLELFDNAVQESQYGTIHLDASIWNSTMQPTEGQGEEDEARDHRTQSSMSGRFFLHDEEAPIFDQLSYLKIEISDTARKIPKPLLAELFHPFYGTGRQTLRKRRSIKFGLSMARSMARIAGGKLRLVQRDTPGNTFLLLLPAVVNNLPRSGRTNELEPDVVPHVGMSLENYRILIVDANAANQIFVETILNNAGARTEMAGNGFEAVELLLGERRLGRFFDLVVMDSQLPRMSGCNMAATIRNFGFMRPIVFIGSSSDKPDFQVGESDAILTKPVDRQILIQTIIRLTDGRRSAGYWQNRPVDFFK